MTRVKICGITNKDDFDAAAAYGADALGFIGVDVSPRYLAPAQFSVIAGRAPALIPRIVVVHRPEDACAYTADYVQYYTDTDILAPPIPRIKCFRMRGPESLDEIRAFIAAEEDAARAATATGLVRQPAAAILLDAYHQDKLGGSGEVFNWRLAMEAKSLLLKERPLILAGGLTAENVQDALSAVRPYAVDVASGVESSPGVKDHVKLRAFIRAVREWDVRFGPWTDNQL